MLKNEDKKFINFYTVREEIYLEITKEYLEDAKRAGHVNSVVWRDSVYMKTEKWRNLLQEVKLMISHIISQLKRFRMLFIVAIGYRGHGSMLLKSKKIAILIRHDISIFFYLQGVRKGI